MKLRELIENFCMEHEDYKFEADGCVGTADIAHCIGVSLPGEGSYMDMLSALTEYLDQHHFDDPDLELSNPVIDELADRVVVYFPYCH